MPAIDQLVSGFKVFKARYYEHRPELYENLHYARAGLCRSPLERATEAELQTRQLLQRLHP